MCAPSAVPHSAFMWRDPINCVPYVCAPPLLSSPPSGAVCGIVVVCRFFFFPSCFVIGVIALFWGVFFACCCFSSSFLDLSSHSDSFLSVTRWLSAQILTSSSFFLGMFQHLHFFLDGADLCCLVVFGQSLWRFCCNADASLFYTHTKARKFPCAGSRSSPAALGNTSFETTTT